MSQNFESVFGLLDGKNNQQLKCSLKTYTMNQKLIPHLTMYGLGSPYTKTYVIVTTYGVITHKVTLF